MCVFLLSILDCFVYCFFFFFKQKTAYEMRISDWSSDVCSSDLCDRDRRQGQPARGCGARRACVAGDRRPAHRHRHRAGRRDDGGRTEAARAATIRSSPASRPRRSEEHTSELQSLMRISYAVFCLKKKKNKINIDQG